MSFVKLNELAKDYGNYYVVDATLWTKQYPDEDTELTVVLNGQTSAVQEEEGKPTPCEIYLRVVDALNKKSKE